MSKEKIETGCKSTQTTLDRKTGSWRSFHPIVTDRCIGCSTCVSICPEGCISLVGGDKKKAKIDYDYCKGCLICMTQCPSKAIEKSEGK